MLPDSDNGSRFFFLFPLYCLIDVRDAGGTQMVILRRNIPTCLPLYNQANIGQRDCPCLQIVWQPSRRRTVVGVLGYNKYDYRKSIIIDYVSVCYSDFVKRTTYHQKKIMSHQCHNHKFCVPKK